MINLSIGGMAVLLPLFVLEELGIPLPLILSGIFTYAGYALFHGQPQALLLVPINSIGAVTGASLVYWAARIGIAQVLLQRILRRRAVASLQTPTEQRGFWRIPPVLLLRFAPIPPLIISAYAGTARIGYPTFVMAVIFTTFVWNVPFLSIGFVGGLVSDRLIVTPHGWALYVPWLGIWGVTSLIFILIRRIRHKRSKKTT